VSEAAASDWARVRAAFQRIWGYAEFRPPQAAVVQALLQGQDALIVLPTGAGKSLCFQLPAVLQSGLTLVVSPLVALMENQVQDLQRRQLPAAALHGELSSRQRRQVLGAIAAQQLRLLYVSPEMLLGPTLWPQLAHPQLRLNALVVDEAHCLALWGDTFRPAYQRLGAVRPALLAAKPPGTTLAIAAFTATADAATQQLVSRTLQLRQPLVQAVSPYRPNLCPRVRTVRTPRGRRRQLLAFVRERAGQPGLIYVRSRAACEALARWLRELGWRTAAYHAGLPAQQRRAIEADWLAERTPFAVCTAAFGMGIDKPNVGWVAHYQPPLLLAEYVQEIGRGGRDGQSAPVLALASEPTGWLDPSDTRQRQWFARQRQQQYRQAQQLAQRIPSQGEVAAVAQQFPQGAMALALLHRLGRLSWTDPFHYRLHPTPQASTASDRAAEPARMRAYLYARGCRWQFLLQAFGFERAARGFHCGHCDNCQRSRSGRRQAWR